MRQLTRDLKSQNKTYTFRNKKRSNEMVESWIASLPTYTLYKEGLGDKQQQHEEAVSHSLPVTETRQGDRKEEEEEEEEGGSAASTEAYKNHEAFSGLSVVIPETFTNIQKDVSVK